MNFEHLLEEYRKIWNNRRLDAGNSESELILKEAIKRELLDGNSHPRTRKSPFEKYFSASKRLLASGLEDKDKISLLQLHVDVLSTLEQR